MIQPNIPFTRVSDVQAAKNWLKAWPDKWFSVEELKNQANLDIGVPALARKMRLARQRGEIEARMRPDKTYKEYRWVEHMGNNGEELENINPEPDDMNEHKPLTQGFLL